MTQRIDDSHLTKDGNVIVDHSIVDIEIFPDYIVGLRLPAQHLECNNGNSLKIVLNNIKQYFIKPQ